MDRRRFGHETRLLVISSHTGELAVFFHLLYIFFLALGSALLAITPRFDMHTLTYLQTLFTERHSVFLYRQCVCVFRNPKTWVAL